MRTENAGGEVVFKSIFYRTGIKADVIQMLIDV